MSPVEMIATGLQLLSSWLMSMLTVLTLVVSAVVGIAFVEFVCDRASIAQAYTVKLRNGESQGAPASRTRAT